MTDLDIRWKQRLKNYERALTQLREAVALSHQRPLSNLEQQGLIQAFEFTHELAWNVMKDYLAYQGAPDISGSRDAARASFAQGLVADGEGWMEMIKSRNQSSHTYNQGVADAITRLVVSRYTPLFEAFAVAMQSRLKGSNPMP
jgi:nucleotidyltransferase substrate binding protein (TIGR01987 family)